MGCKFLQNYVHLAAQEGINRYIVGCKLLTVTCFIPVAVRINRYIVGCKSDYDVYGFFAGLELIDT